MENTPATNDGLTAAQRYRKSEKCALARKRYYDNKGKQTAQSYYEKNKEKINEASKARYAKLKEALEKADTK
jgi:hypothetical protein